MTSTKLKGVDKGILAENLAKLYFTRNGDTVLIPEGHNNPFDFVVYDGTTFHRVQVKSTINVKADGYEIIRIRNKHGSTNKPYGKNDYDILAGVDVDNQNIYLFYSYDINDGSCGEALSVARTDGKPLNNRFRPEPFYEGRLF